MQLLGVVRDGCMGKRIIDKMFIQKTKTISNIEMTSQTIKQSSWINITSYRYEYAKWTIERNEKMTAVVVL